MSDPDALADLADPDGEPSGQGLTGRQIQQLAVRGSMWTAIHAVTSVPIAFVSNAVIARALGVADYGSLAFLTIAFALATQIANAGFSDSVIQAGSAAESRGDKSQTDRLLGRAFGFHLLVEMPLLWAVSLFLARDESPAVAVTLVAATAVTCVFGSATLALTVENRSAVMAKLAMGSNLVLQVVVALVAVLTVSPLAVVAARLLLAAVAVPINLVALDPARRRAVLRLRLPRRLPAGFWVFAGQSFVAGLLGMLVFSRSEVLLLQWLATPEAVGVFALAFGLSYQLTAPVDALLNPLVPAITGLVSARPDLARRALLRALRFSALLSALITAAVLPAVYFAIPVIYGEQFRPTADLLLPLAAASCAQSIAAPLIAFVYARRRGGMLVRANAIALTVNVAAAVPLIAWVGVWGAVIANVVGQGASIAVLSRGELRTSEVTLGQGAAVTLSWPLSVVAAAVAVLLGRWLEHEGWPLPVIAVVAALVGALALVLAVRSARAGLDGEDRDALVDAMPAALRRVVAASIAPFVRPVPQQ